jgi:hypothetical protein
MLDQQVEELVAVNQADGSRTDVQVGVGTAVAKCAEGDERAAERLVVRQGAMELIEHGPAEGTLPPHPDPGTLAHALSDGRCRSYRALATHEY